MKRGGNGEISELTVRAGLCAHGQHRWECLPHMERNR